MASVALIGPDGAGKTTLARMLEDCELRPIRCLYMGVAIPSSNVMLPTTRLAAWLKERVERPRRSEAGPEHPAPGIKGGGGRSRLRAAARLTNRLLEEWYRQLVSAWYQLRGYVVLYDRHFLFDYAPEIMAGERETLEQRVHRWSLTYCYPRPDLVIFLDAPGEVLFARKGELSPKELERRRQAFLRQGERLTNFVRVDATSPLDQVHDEVLGHVLRASGGRRAPAPHTAS
jgi:thymidylate kinase